MAVKHTRAKHVERRPGIKVARYRWVVEFEVDEVWVADGFDLTDACAQNMIEQRLAWARPYEVGARVVRSPDPAAMAKAREAVCD